MAVGAEQDALLRLLTQARQRARQAATGKTELLLPRIQVVELQGTNVGVIPAAHALATSLPHDPRSQLAPALHHGVPATSAAAIDALRAEDERRLTMRRAVARERADTFPPTVPRLAARLTAPCLEPIALQPVPDGGNAHLEIGGDRTVRAACGDQLLEHRL